MPAVPQKRVRNIGIVAHIDAGKTTTTERFLYYAGKSHKIGEVHDGEAIMDFRDDERARGITISGASTTLYWNGHRINLIDTPGHVDFTAEVERALRVLDGAVVVFDGVAGVEPQSETVWHQADRYQVPRIALVNKMDRVGADFDMNLESIRDRLGGPPIAIQFPDGGGEEFSGIVDLVEEKYLTFEASSLGKEVYSEEVPERLRSECSRRRDEMIESLAELHDPLTDKYLNGERMDAWDLHEAIRAVTLSRRAVPVLCGAALANAGIQPVLDAICRYLPSPGDMPPVEGESPDGKRRLTRRPSKNEPFCALLFKLTAESAADLFHLRVYSGSLKSGDSVWNPRTGRKTRLRRIVRMHADRREPVEVIEPGDIVAVTGLTGSVSGDTLCDAAAPILLEPIKFPCTVVSIAIEPKTNADRDQLEDILVRLQKEDPTLLRSEDKETGQTLLSGMGELHLEVVLDRMKSDFGLEVKHGNPRVSYRESVRTTGIGVSEYNRKVAGENLYARVELSVGPARNLSDPLVVEDRLEPGSIPAHFIPALLESAVNAAAGGGVFGYPESGIRIVLRSARYEDAGQPEIALNSATSLAFRDALRTADPVVLEPYGKLEVRVPEEYLGGIVKSLNHNRALIEETDYLKNAVLIRGVVPIAEMFGYLTELRSMSQGRGSFSLEPLDYRPVPDNLIELHHERLYD